jgi:hypothetical protein
LDNDLLDQRVIVDNDGAGRLTVTAEWPHGARQDLTRQFSEFVDQLWTCLDCLITESMTMYSIRRRPRDLDRPELVLEAVARLMAVFAELTRQTPGSRRVSTSTEHGEAWTSLNRFAERGIAAERAAQDAAATWGLPRGTSKFVILV